MQVFTLIAGVADPAHGIMPALEKADGVKNPCW
jgi:hypothetical protein